MKTINIKPFIASLVATVCCQLLFTILVTVGFTPTRVFQVIPALSARIAHFTSPLPKAADVFDTIRPKLELKNNSFQLKKETSLIEKANAAFEEPDVSAYSVVDLQTGEILLSKDGDKQLPIASLTKVMTAVVALDVASTKDSFSVSKTAENMIPTKIGVQAGNRITLGELLPAMLLTSANDAAEVVKEGVDTKYNQPIFIRAMNEKARFLNLTHTHFTNPQGFDDPNHFSSANDLAVLSEYALTQYPEILSTVNHDYEFIPATSTHGQYDLYNWNSLVGVYPGAYGVKIGNTDDAGKTIIVAAERNGKKLVVVVLGAQTIQQRDAVAANLLDEGFLEKYNMPKVNVTEKQFQAKYNSWKYWN